MAILTYNLHTEKALTRHKRWIQTMKYYRTFRLRRDDDEFCYKFHCYLVFNRDKYLPLDEGLVKTQTNTSTHTHTHTHTNSVFQLRA